MPLYDGAERQPEPDLGPVRPGLGPALGPARGLERADVGGRVGPAVAGGLLGVEGHPGGQADQVAGPRPVGHDVAVETEVGAPVALDTRVVDRRRGKRRWKRRKRSAEEQPGQDDVAAGGPVDGDHDRAPGPDVDRRVDPGAGDERVRGEPGGLETVPVVDADVLAARTVRIPVEGIEMERAL